MQAKTKNDEGQSDWSPTGEGTTKANNPPVFTDGSSASVQLAENTPAGWDVGNPISATDEESASLNYTLSGTDSSNFSIVASTGQIQTGSGATFDYESDKTSHSVIVTATDGHSGSATIAVTVNVTNVPEPPEQPAAPTVTAGAQPRTLSVSWQEPDNTGPSINDYDLQYRKNGDTPWSGWNHAGTDRTSVITGLIAGETYQVQVKAINEEGASGWSASGEGDTADNQAPEFNDDQGSATPRSITETVGDATDTGRTVGTPVSATDTDGGTPTYSLGGADAGSFAINSTTGQISTKAGQIYDHEEKSSYSLTVAANDGQEQPLGTNSIAVTVNVTDVDEPPVKPSPPTFSGTQRYRTTAAWTAPPNTGRPAITGHELRYGTGVDVSTHTTRDAGNSLSLTVESLEDGETYNFQVRAENVEGWGPWSEFAAVTALANQEPSFTDGATATRTLPENSQAGTNAGTPVGATDTDSDTLEYSLTGSNPADFTVDPSDGQIRAGSHNYNHESTDSYTLTLKVVDGHNGNDTITVTVNITDVLEPPEKPEPPTASQQSLTGITFKWQEPDNTGPAITDYDAQWRKGTTGGWTDVSTSLTRSVVLSDLYQNSTYQLQVKATNDEGDSDWSNPGASATNQNSPPSFNEGTETTRSVPENTATATDVGNPMAVTDSDIDDGGSLSYGITTPGVPFTVDSSTGQIKTVTGANYDHETKPSHQFNAQVQDGQGGSDSIEVTINITDVDEPPGAPEAPTSSDSTINSVTIDWTEPDNTGPAITDYDVQYGTDGVSWEPHDFTGTGLTTTVTGLDRGTTYRFQVNAENDEGISDWSASSSHATKPNSQPTFSTGTSRVTIEIPEDTPGGTDIGDPIEAGDGDRDTITYSLEGDDMEMFAVDSTGQVRTKSNTGFNYEETPNSYNITVKIDDGEGGENTRDVTVNITDVLEPPGGTGAPRLTGASSTGMTASWEAPDNRGPAIDRYRVRYGESADGPWRNPDHSGAGTTATLRDLTPGAQYWVRVQAHNDEGWGQWSDAARQTTGANNPPSFQETGPASVRSLPENTPAGTNVGPPVGATDVESPSLTYRLGGADAAHFQIVASTGQVQTTAGAIYNFESAKTSYSLTVTATDGHDAETERPLIINITDVLEPPERPAKPDVTGATLSSLTVTWQEPENTGPPISDYDLRYRRSTTSPWTDAGSQGTARTTRLENLQQSQDYQVQVKAHNDEGASDWSDSATGRTGDAPQVRVSFGAGDILGHRGRR